MQLIRQQLWRVLLHVDLASSKLLSLVEAQRTAFVACGWPRVLQRRRLAVKRLVYLLEGGDPPAPPNTSTEVVVEVVDRLRVQDPPVTTSQI